MVKKKTGHRCDHVKKDGTPCERMATYRVAEKDLWLCGMHKRRAHTEAGKEWKPEDKKIRVKKVSKNNEKYMDMLRHSGALRCSFTLKSGEPCLKKVSYRLDDGRACCFQHKKILERLDPMDKELMETRSVDTLMEKRISALEGTKKDEKRVIDMPDVEEQVEKIKEIAEKEDFSVRFKRDPNNPKLDQGGKTSAFFGIDVEYYTPEFKYEYVHLLMAAIRRAEAQVNIYFQQLQRIEFEEQLMKETERSGTMATDKGEVKFKNKEIRHSIPMELKLRLMDNLTKAEAHYAKLLKQLQELPLVALMVLRKMGVKWDREAAMMVIHKLETQENQILTDFGEIGSLEMKPVYEIKTSDEHKENVAEMIRQDPKTAKNLKSLLETDDDW